MFGQPGRPSCDHRRVSEGDDVGSAPTSEPPADSFEYTKAPESTVAKTVVGVLITIVVIAAIVIGGFVLSIYDRLGGVAFEPTDHTVRSARMKADQMARGDLEIIVKELAPTLGTPTKRALLDVCHDAHMAWSWNNDITCTRSFYLYYPIAGDAPTASSLTETLTTAASQFHHVLACSSIGVQRDCEATGGAIVLHEATVATEKDPFYEYEGSLVEMDGYRELVFAAAKGHYVVVLFTVQYFLG